MHDATRWIGRWIHNQRSPGVFKCSECLRKVTTFWVLDRWITEK